MINRSPARLLRDMMRVKRAFHRDYNFSFFENFPSYDWLSGIGKEELVSVKQELYGVFFSKMNWLPSSRS